MKKIIVGILIGVLLTSTAYGIGEVKSAKYNDTKIRLNGEELNLTLPCVSIVDSKDPNGYASNYLSVREVGEALNLDVDWEGESKTVILNSKNINAVNKVGKVEVGVAQQSNIDKDWDWVWKDKRLEYYEEEMFKVKVVKPRIDNEQVRYSQLAKLTIQ